MVDRRHRLVVLIKISCHVKYLGFFLFFFLLILINHKMYLIPAGSGKVLVLSQAFCSTYQKHRLEFTARNEEELNNILKDMRTTDNSESFQYNVLRYVAVQI